MTELNNHYEPEEVESQVKRKWSDEETYKRVKKQNADNETYYFLDGPPFTSGRMHCGTAWGKLLKDSFLRYYRMNGYNVKDTPGYDTHGLPVEVKVEQKHGFSNKQDIVDYGVEEFVEECKKYVHEQKEVMDEEFQDMGVWMDWDEPYLTMNKQYMNTVWGSFSKLYEKNLVGRGFDVLNTCPRCETTLSDSELDYDNRTVKATYVEFELKNSKGSLVAWTTTPWTVVGNQFVAVHKDLEYAGVKDKRTGKVYYVAENCVENLVNVCGFEDYEVVNNVTGDYFVGMEYEHPLPNQKPHLPTDKFYVEHADYVEAEKTGFVHSAPGFGHEDYDRGQELDLHPYSPVDADGQFSDTVPNYNGLYVHTDGAEAVRDQLSDNGYLMATETYTHEYPHCPRCDTDVVFQAREQWFFKATEMKDGLQSAIDNTEWYPQAARDERFRNTVKNAPDWNVSRQRYWGTPLPVWVCEDCEHDTVVSSSSELVERSVSEDVTELDDLHRPSVDPLVVECEECGGNAHRVEDVLDVWFDSSVASWGSLGVQPDKNPRPKSWPSDLIVEGHDQTRGWFLMQLYMGVALSDEAPYKDVLMHGFALLDGKPMSKSRGHVLRPPEVIKEHGRDAMRSYMLSNEEQESDVNMTSDMQGVESMKRKLDVVWNVYRFALMYMDQDDYTGTKNLQYSDEERTVLDNWVLSRLDSVHNKSTEAFENREPHKALSSTLDFLVNDVSRYYVKTIRDRVWVSEDTKDKQVAYDTLMQVMFESCKLLAPFTPYLSERLYNSLPVEDKTFSVHGDNWNHNRERLCDPELESDVKTVRDVEEGVSHLRDQEGRKQRWPLKTVYVVPSDEDVKEQVQKYTELLENRVNAYQVEVLDEYSNVDYVLEPDMSEMGPKFGSVAQEVAEKVRGLKEKQLPVTVEVDEQNFTVDKSLVTVNKKLPSNVRKGTFNSGELFVDFTVDKQVETDGYTRDLVRQAQEMRSDMDLDMETTVNLSVQSESEKVKNALNRNEEYVRDEVRVAEFDDDLDGYSVKSSLNGQEVVFVMEKHD